MKYIVLGAMLLSCAGCANREVAISYTPGRIDPAAMLEAAEKECGKYGMVAVPAGRSFWTAYGRESEQFACKRTDGEWPFGQQRFGWWTWTRPVF